MCTKQKYDILSLNVRGIRDQVKRRSIFSYLKDQKGKFYFLQETYSDLNDEIIWKNEWGGDIFYSHGTKHSKGVCILIDTTMQIKVENIFRDNSGRIVLITIVHNSVKLSLCNIYAPNSLAEQLEFIQELNNCLIDKSELSELIVGGDWNCTLSKKDKIGGSTWKPTNYRDLVLITMDVFNLVDIQRQRHPKLRKYSYESKFLKVKSRIDFFLVAKSLTKYVKSTEIFPAIAPDHNAIYISLSIKCETPRGPGLWKFNNTLLNDERYVAEIKETYSRTRDYYSHLENRRLFWEMLKMEIRAATIVYAKNKAKTSNTREVEIKRQLDELDNIICDNFDAPNIDEILEEYDKLKFELRSIYEHKGKAAIFRSKCRWIEKGERSTKYFFNLEKRNYNKKTISELRLQDETTTNNEKLILESIESYYEDLYTSDNTFSQTDYDELVNDLQIPTLSDEDRDNLEGLLSYEECEKVLETFKSDKAPGEDGFTAEFYKFFFDMLGHDLVACFNEAHAANELSISQRRGVITLIPKESDSLLELSNWRPITLLNVDCKIAAKAIAKRLEPILPKLVHSDQTGFIKGRYIGENIRLISDIMDYTKSQKIPGILVSLDFQKAFDSLEWPFIMKTLDKFNFGSSMKRWVSTFYENIESAVINNGFATNWFRPSKGVRQGCPLSPYLFILSTEILSQKIRQDSSIKGIKLLGNEIKLSQFADDTNLFCANLNSVENALRIVGEFGNIAGLKLNVKKTKAIWLGSWANNKNNPLKIKWLHSPVKILGIYFSYDENGNNNLNFNLKIKKLQTNLDLWKSRDLTLFGKVLILKTLGLSQLVYSASNLNVPEEISDIAKKKLFNFLWNGKRDKIKRAGLYQDFDSGGLRMTDVGLMLKALKLAWIPRLIIPGNQNWKTVPNYFFRKMGGLNFLLRCNYDIGHLKQLPTFYKNILRIFTELKTLYGYNKDDLILFNNKEILVDNKPVFIWEWFNKSIIYIKDLLKPNGQLLSFSEFVHKYPCKTNYLQFYQIISAIPKHLLTKAKNMEFLRTYVENDSIFQLNETTQINLEKAQSREFYQLLNNKTHCVSQTGPGKWSQTLSLNEQSWTLIFKFLKNICKENKLKDFQFRFIHRIIVTKKELFRYGFKADDECLYCGEHDSINHTFIDCTFVKSFVQNVINWFNKTYASQINPTIEEQLFGIHDSSLDNNIKNSFNFISLVMRYYIYTCKLHNKAILLPEFVDKFLPKYCVGNLN